MDTSETYAKMCEKAKEIQKDWFPVEGDFCIYKRGLQDRHITILSAFMKYAYSPDFDWLPRQDQLQEMVLKTNTGIWDLFGKIGRWCSAWDESIGGAGYYATGEQLWLAFVMKKKYNKTWNGGDWVTY